MPGVSIFGSPESDSSTRIEIDLVYNRYIDYSEDSMWKGAWTEVGQIEVELLSRRTKFFHDDALNPLRSETVLQKSYPELNKLQSTLINARLHNFSDELNVWLPFDDN